jgi:hypothetical protein
VVLPLLKAEEVVEVVVEVEGAAPEEAGLEEVPARAEV